MLGIVGVLACLVLPTWLTYSRPSRTHQPAPVINGSTEGNGRVLEIHGCDYGGSNDMSVLVRSRNDECSVLDIRYAQAWLQG